MAVRFKLLKDLFETGLMIAMDRQAGNKEWKPAVSTVR